MCLEANTRYEVCAKQKKKARLIENKTEREHKTKTENLIKLCMVKVNFVTTKKWFLFTKSM
jgi:hypothetical protein